MLINEMHYRFKQELDRVDSNDRPDFLPWEIDAYLYKGILLFVKDRYGVHNKIKEGFESNEMRTENLRNLHIKSPESQAPVVPQLIYDGYYEVNLNQLEFRFMFLTDAYIEADKDGCTGFCDAKQWQTDDVKTTYTQPSFKWRRVLMQLAKSNSTTGLNQDLGSLYFDTRDRYGVPQFTITKAFISYIKYPNEVFFGGYDHINGIYTAGDPQVHCDIDDAFHEEIVSIAVMLAQKDIQDPNGVKLQTAKYQIDRTL
jgi:hypothetical protein